MAITLPSASLPPLHPSLDETGVLSERLSALEADADAWAGPAGAEDATRAFIVMQAHAWKQRREAKAHDAAASEVPANVAEGGSKMRRRGYI